MTIASIVIGIIIALFVIFILIGVFVPEVKYDAEVEVKKPLDHSWTIFMDDSRMGEWLIGYKSAEHLSGDHNKPGSTYKMIFTDPKGKDFEMIEEITVVDEKKQFSFDLDHKIMKSECHVLFENQGDKTIIKGITKAKGKGVIMRSLFPIMLRQMKKQNQMVYDNLKRVIEAS